MVEQVLQFNKLGVNITSSGNLVIEIKTQAQKAARVADCLNDLVWRNKYMSVCMCVFINYNYKK